MSEESGAATMEVPAEIKDLGEKIVKLTLLEAKSLVDYLKDEHGIEPAAGGGVMMAGPAAADAGPGSLAWRYRSGQPVGPVYGRAADLFHVDADACDSVPPGVSAGHERWRLPAYQATSGF